VGLELEPDRVGPSGSKPERGQLPAAAAAQLGSQRVAGIAQHAVEQMLGPDPRIATTGREPRGHLQGALCQHIRTRRIRARVPGRSRQPCPPRRGNPGLGALWLWPCSAISCPSAPALTSRPGHFGSGLDELQHVIGGGRPSPRGPTRSRRWWRPCGRRSGGGVGLLVALEVRVGAGLVGGTRSGRAVPAHRVPPGLPGPAWLWYRMG